MYAKALGSMNIGELLDSVSNGKNIRIALHFCVKLYLYLLAQDFCIEPKNFVIVLQSQLPLLAVLPPPRLPLPPPLPRPLPRSLSPRRMPTWVSLCSIKEFSIFEHDERRSLCRISPSQ
jgi:hypothetical protein